MSRFRGFKYAGCLLAAALLAAAAWGDKSLYAPPLKWVTDQGKPARLADWKGKQVVLTMAYTSCHGSCPLIIKKLRKIEQAFQAAKQPVSFVIVTLDPKNDTPKELHAYRERSGLAADRNWTFLTGQEADVRRLSLLLGISFSKPPGSSEIMHDNKIVLLSPSGEITKRLDSLDDDETKLLK